MVRKTFSSNKRNIILLALIAVSIVVGLVYYSNQNKFIPFSNTKYEYTFNYPEGYSISPAGLDDEKKVQEGISFSELNNIYFYDENGARAFLVGTYPNNGNLNSKEIVDRFIRAKEEGRDAFDYTSRNDVEVAGGLAHALINDTGNEVHITLVYSLGEDVLDLRYSYEKKNLEKQKIMEKIVSSIKPL